MKRTYLPLTAAALAGAIALAAHAIPSDARAPVLSRMPAPPAGSPAAKGDQVAVLAGGCFWGVEGVYDHVKGVKSVTAGYAGGTRADASYARVSTERTGHAEAVRIVYDPAQVSYGTLLKVFFAVAHDPTQLNRQFPDSGPSYRSAIFPQDAAQQKIARAYIAALGKSGAFDKPVVTRIESGQFYPAESWHQDYLRRNPQSSYIRRYDMPKLAALKTSYPALWRN